MKIVATAVVVVGLLGWVEVAALAAPLFAKNEAAQVDALFRPWNSPSSPGCAVSVLKDGHVVYERGYGVADLDHDLRITPATVFDVGSIAKQFTAAAILMLIHDSKLSLDDPIRNFIPGLPDYARRTTIRQLLYHASGIRDYQQLLWFDGWRLDSPDQVTEGDIDYIISRQKALNFSPGTDFSYSNTNYVLLAQVVSQLSKKSFPDFTKERLFQPLGMNNTHFRTDHGEIIKNVAYSYEKRTDGFYMSLPNYDNYGDTDLFTTVEDLARWEENIHAARVGGAWMIEGLKQPGELNDGTRLNYAPGMFVDTANQLEVMESGNAGDAGYRANVLRSLGERFSVVTLCNLGSIDPMDLCRRIADIYLGAKFGMALLAQDAPSGSFHPDQKELRAHAGTYVDESEDQVLELEQRGEDGLWGELYTGPSTIGPARLEALTKDRFRGLGLKELDFGRDSKQAGATALRFGLPSQQYRRVPAYKPTTEQLREFVGEYDSNELDVPYYVTLTGDHLVLHPPKMPARPLSPIKAELFIGEGFRIRFTRNARGMTSGFLMSGPWNRTQNVRFERASGPEHFLLIR